MSWPRIATESSLAVVAVGWPLEGAVWAALRDLILRVVELTGMSDEEAYALVGTADHARPGQAQVGHCSMRCTIEKQFLQPGVGAGA